MMPSFSFPSHPGFSHWDHKQSDYEGYVYAQNMDIP